MAENSKPKKPAIQSHVVIDFAPLGKQAHTLSKEEALALYEALGEALSIKKPEQGTNDINKILKDMDKYRPYVPSRPSDPFMPRPYYHKPLDFPGTPKIWCGDATQRVTPTGFSHGFLNRPTNIP